MAFQCLHCTASYVEAEPLIGGGFRCPNCKASISPSDLEALYGPVTKGAAQFTCYRCAGHSFFGMTGQLTELAHNFWHCDVPGGCKALYVFPVSTIEKQCAFSLGKVGCKETVYVDTTEDIANSQFYCMSHAIPSIFMGNHQCTHQRFMAADYRFGPLEEWKCLDCTVWYHAKYADYRPTMPMPPPKYSVVPNQAAARQTPAPNPFLNNTTPNPFAAPMGLGAAIAAAMGGWHGGLLNTDDEPITPTLPPKPAGRCTQCKRELSATMDAYYGRDFDEAAKCSPCRAGRRH